MTRMGGYLCQKHALGIYPRALGGIRNLRNIPPGTLAPTSCVDLNGAWKASIVGPNEASHINFPTTDCTLGKARNKAQKDKHMRTHTQNHGLTVSTVGFGRVQFDSVLGFCQRFGLGVYWFRLVSFGSSLY